MRRATTIVSPVGRTLCSIVAQRPGIHFRALCRAANLRSAGQLRHHLDRLEAARAIVEVREGQFRRYFLPGHYHASTMPALARFSREMSRRIGMLLLQRPMRRGELRRHLGCADSTLGYHLRRLVASGDLQRSSEDQPVYSLAQPDLFRRLIEDSQAPEAQEQLADTSDGHQPSRLPYQAWAQLQGVSASEGVAASSP